MTLLGGCAHAGAGPVIGYAVDHGPILGVEASGGVAVMQASLGGAVRPEAEDGKTLTAHLTFDPSLAVPPEPVGVGLGGTFGVGFDGNEGGRVTGGYVSAFGPLRDDARCSPDETATVWSVALVIRTIGETLEVFATPKLNVVGGCPRLGFGDSGDNWIR